MPVQRPYNPNAKRMAEMMQADLAKVGINAKLVSYRMGRVPQAPAGGRAPDGPARLDRRQWRSGQLLLPARLRRGARERRPEHLQVVQQGLRGQAVSRRKKLSEKADRTKLYEEMQVIAKEEAPIVTIAHSTVFEPMRKEVSDYKVSPFGRHEFYGVDITE